MRKKFELPPNIAYDSSELYMTYEETKFHTYPVVGLLKLAKDLNLITYELFVRSVEEFFVYNPPLTLNLSKEKYEENYSVTIPGAKINHYQSSTKKVIIEHLNESTTIASSYLHSSLRPSTPGTRKNRKGLEF